MARSSVPSVGAPDASLAGGVSARSPTINLLISLRPGQWTKNFVIFAGLLFGRQLFDLRSVAATIAAFFIFCGLSGVVYLVTSLQTAATIF